MMTRIRADEFREIVYPLPYGVEIFPKRIPVQVGGVCKG